MLARTNRLIVEKLGSEAVVYDLDSKKAHCLNEPVRWIWEQCDGKRSASSIAADFEKRYPGADSSASVEAGLRQLMAANLLEGEAPADRTFSRRKVMGVAAPLIVSVAVPAASAAMSGREGAKPRVKLAPPPRVPRTPTPRRSKR